MPTISFTAFDARISRSDFDCGNHEINEWFRTQAGQQHRRDAARTTFGWDASDARVTSFYTLVAHQLEPGAGLRASVGASHQHQVPAILIAQLGVDQRYQGRGVGSMTMGHALRTLLRLSESLGFQVVVVDAVDAEAQVFYEKFGFELLAGGARRLALTTRQLREWHVHM